MKPSYEELEQMLEESQREFRSADITMQNLEAKCEKLAAENAGLKAASSCLVSEYMMNKGTDSEFIACITPSKKTIGTGGAWDMWRHLDMVLDKTQSTDAFLAEVRASGADELAKLYFTLAAHEANRYIADSWRESARFAKDHAAQLRKGGAE